MPHSSGSGLNAPGGCLSKPTTSATSALPAASIACAVISAEPPVAQPFLTLMKGTPVRPSTDTVVSALPAASEPPAANSIASQPMPASASAARAAWAAISRPDTPGWRPKGWMPSPTTATASALMSLVLHAAWKAKAAPSSRVSSIAIPIRRRSGSDSVRRASTRTSPGSST